MSDDENTKATIGLILLAISACLELLCLFLVRILRHTNQSGHIITVRMWLHMSAALEQITFIVFNVRYHFITSDFNVQEPCIVLRCLSSMASTMTNCWIFVISALYLVLTIKPTTCSTFRAHSFSNCCTLTWTCASCLTYLMLSFLLEDQNQFLYERSCWESNVGSLHTFMTYGIELLPFVFAFIFFSCARCRVPLKQSDLQIQTLNNRSDDLDLVNLDGMPNTINRYLILCAFIAIYYIILVFKFLIDEGSSDLIIVTLKSSKGIVIAIMTCFVSNDIISVFSKNKTSTKQTRKRYVSFAQTDSAKLEMYSYISETGC